MKILLLENDPVDAERVLRILEPLPQFKVIHELSLAMAFPMLARREADVVLLDLSLSDCDCLAAIRSLKTLSDVPIIVLSGAPEEAVREEAIDQGAFRFLSKSSNLELNLPATVADALLGLIP